MAAPLLCIDLDPHDDRQVIAADFRSQSFVRNADWLRHQAVIKRNSRQRHPVGPRSEKATSLGGVPEATIGKQISKERTPRSGVQIPDDDDRRGLPADKGRDFLELIIPQVGVLRSDGR